MFRCMTPTNINATISPENLQEIKSQLADVQAKLGFLVNVQPEDRQSMRTLGDKLYGYVRDVLTLTQSYPNTMAKDFEVDQFAQDFAAYDNLGSILAALTGLTESVKDTRMALGSQLATQAKHAHQYLREGAERDTALHENLKGVSARSSRGPKSDASAPAPSPSVQEQTSSIVNS
jgi:hypothetical protein